MYVVCVYCTPYMLVAFCVQMCVHVCVCVCMDMFVGELGGWM